MHKLKEKKTLCGFIFLRVQGQETPRICTIFSKKLFVYQKEGNNNHFFQFFQVDSSAQTIYCSE